MLLDMYAYLHELSGNVSLLVNTGVYSTCTQVIVMVVVVGVC